MGVRTMLYVVVYLYLLYVTVVFPAYTFIHMEESILPILGMQLVYEEDEIEFYTSFGYNTYSEDRVGYIILSEVGEIGYIAYPILSSERYWREGWE